MPISMIQENQTYYLHYDQVGTLRAVTDTNHNIIKEVTYDTFGNILSDTNENFNIPFGFAGGLHDIDTDIVHFGYREYDPVTGKWTAKDPIGFGGGDSNLYGYVLQNPVNFIDPWGLRSLCESLDLLGDKLTDEIPDDIEKAWEEFIKNGLPEMWENTPWYAKLPLLHASGIAGLGLASGASAAYNASMMNPMPVYDFISGFQSVNNWNATNRYQNYGRGARYMFDEIFK